VPRFRHRFQLVSIEDKNNSALQGKEKEGKEGKLAWTRNLHRGYSKFVVEKLAVINKPFPELISLELVLKEGNERTNPS